MTDHRALLPASQNLHPCSSPDNERGELHIQMPFETEDVLTLRWEKITTFDNGDEDFLYAWGKHQRGDKKGAHVLGRFFLNGEELERAPLSRDVAEYFWYARCDHLGCEYDEGCEHFDADHGFDCTPLMSHVPKRTGQFNAQTPTQELLSIRFGHKGSYRLSWSAKGGARWDLEVNADRSTTDRGGSLSICVITKYEFDFFERVCAFSQICGLNEM